MENTLTIETMQAGDIEAAIAVQCASFDEHLRESRAVFADRFQRFGQYFLVVREQPNRTVVGYALSFPWQLGSCPTNNRPFPVELPEPNCFYLHDITLLPACRGRGAAGALLEAIFKQAHSLGFDKITLVSVAQAGSFWDKQGFVTQNPTPEQQAYILSNYGSGSRLMEKTL